MVAKADSSVWTPDSIGSSVTPSPGSGSSGVISANPAYPGSDMWNQKVWSWHPTNPGGSGSHGTSQDYKTESGITYGQLMQLVGGYDQRAMAYYQQQMVNANLVTPTTIAWGTPDDTTMNAFAEIFAATIRHNQGLPPAQRKTWQEMLAANAKAGGGGSGAPSGGSGSGGPTTSTQTYTSTTGLGASGRYLESAMTRLLGRAPTKDEIANFHGDLNSAEKADPTTRTITSDGQGNVTSHTDQSDVNPYEEANDFASTGKRSTEAGAYGIQQYASALEQLFGGG